MLLMNGIETKKVKVISVLLMTQVRMRDEGSLSKQPGVHFEVHDVKTGN